MDSRWRLYVLRAVQLRADYRRRQSFDLSSLPDKQREDKAYWTEDRPTLSDELRPDRPAENAGKAQASAAFSANGRAKEPAGAWLVGWLADGNLKQLVRIHTIDDVGHDENPLFGRG